MVLAYIQQLSSSTTLIQSAAKLATQLAKTFAVLINNHHEVDNLKLMLTESQVSDCQIIIKNEFDTLYKICETNEVSFLFIQLVEVSKKTIRTLLSDCREIRIPYLFFKDTFTALNLTKIILPVGFLEEELEKAQFAAAFGRFCGSEVKMFQANDFGSKAANNALKMKELFDKFNFQYTIEIASSDSFKIDRESIILAQKHQAGILIVSASRDYGLDDLIFGPKEFHVVKNSDTPVLIVNPRGDLYALCD